MTSPSRTRPASDLIGRDDQLRELRDFIEHSSWNGAAQVLVGDPGVGKTTLLEAACSFADQAGMKVLRVTGTEFEAEISYAGLNALLMPLRETLEEIAPDLREALLVALGLRHGPAPRRLMVYSAVLELMTRTAGDQPVLLCIDDLPWLDRVSAAAVGFLARRVRGIRVGVLAAARTAYLTALEGSGIAVVGVERLNWEHAQELLARRHPILPPRLRGRVLSEADGNPLALLELLKAAPDIADPLAHLPTVLPLTAKLERAFAVRTTGLSEKDRSALLLLAVAGGSEFRYLARSSLTVDDFAAAESAGLVILDHAAMQVVFRHPLMRSAIIGSAALTDLRHAHATIAAHLEDDRARQAWHLAEATITPDEDIAARLELAAREVLFRGDAPVAATLLSRAARLSPLGSAAARRLAEAASLAAQVTGDLASASRFLDEARRLDPRVMSSLHAASAAAYLMVNADGDLDSAHRLLLAAVQADSRQRSTPDHELSEAMTTLLFLCWWAGREDYWNSFERVLSQLGEKVSPVLHLQSRAFADTVRHGTAIRPQLEELIDHLVDEHEPTQIIRVLTSAVYLDMLAGCRTVAWRLVESGRQGGAVRSSLGALMLLCLDDFASGRWEEAERLADEGIERCRAHGYHFIVWYFLYNKAVLAAVRGEPASAHEWVTTLTRVASARKADSPVRYAAHPRALAAIATGDWESAFRHASAPSSPGTFAPHQPVALWVAFDLVESALRTGRIDAARAHAGAIVKNGIAALSPRMAMIASGAQALVTVGEHGEQLFELAINVDGAEDFPFDLARVQLAYGERLRRDLQFVRARHVLHSALETFERLGAAPWAQRARQELRAAREPQATLVPSPENPLTGQERAIAELAAVGMSNKEIARRLYLSPRTVGGHLYRTFPKLGISKRAALRDALDRIPGRATAPML